MLARQCFAAMASRRRGIGRDKPQATYPYNTSCEALHRPVACRCKLPGAKEDKRTSGCHPPLACAPYLPSEVLFSHLLRGGWVTESMRVCLCIWCPPPVRACLCVCVC